MKKLLALSTLALLTLTACGQMTPSNPIQTVTPTESASTELKMEPMDEGEVQPWQEFASEGNSQQTAGDVIISSDKVVTILSGSSSCPPVIEKAEIKDTKIVVELKEANENMACTADLVFYGFKGTADEETLNSVQSGEVKGRNGETNSTTFTRMPEDGPVESNSSTTEDGTPSDVSVPGPNELDS